ICGGIAVFVVYLIKIRRLIRNLKYTAMEEKIITLVTSSFQHAQVLKNILETEGIECFLQNVNAIEGAVNMGVKVRIKESDLEAAIKIIESIEESGIDRFREKKG